MRLAREGESGDAYRIGHGVNWLIFTSLALQLLNPAHLSFALNADTSAAAAQVQSVNLSTPYENPELPQIPYTINTNEVQGGTQISPRFGDVNVSTTTTVPTVDAINVYRLKDSQGSLLAYDIYLPEAKETVAFSAANTIRALAFLDPRLSRWPNAERVELYQRFDQDQNFGSIEETLRNAKRIPADFEPVLNQIKRLTRDTAERYAREKGLIPEPDGE